jgi:hypothetical protein
MSRTHRFAGGRVDGSFRRNLARLPALQQRTGVHPYRRSFGCRCLALLAREPMLRPLRGTYSEPTCWLRWSRSPADVGNRCRSARSLLLSPVISCSLDPETRNFNRLLLIPFCHARGRFARGSSGNPHGRPRGIPNPKRRGPDLAAWPLRAGALSSLIDRKPHLLRPLAAQLLPPPLPPTDPGKHLGIEMASLGTVEMSGRCCPRFWRPLRAVRSRRPRARASHGGCVLGCARARNGRKRACRAPLLLLTRFGYTQPSLAIR